TLLLGVVAAGAFWSQRPVLAKPAKSPSLEAAEVFANNCSSCHGASGRGDGTVTQPAVWSNIEGIDGSRKPRNYTAEWFRFGDSEPAIIATIRNGVPGTAMNGFKDIYPAPVIRELARIVRNFRGKLTNEQIRREHPERIPADIRAMLPH
ncbi:MAG: cytochrome c, partial [Candidatus Sericytochromatia bacterium]|nr:cytochrome c [Candidatus Sericytochromatia bacterium]